HVRIGHRLFDFSGSSGEATNVNDGVEGVMFIHSDGVRLKKAEMPPSSGTEGCHGDGSWGSPAVISSRRKANKGEISVRVADHGSAFLSCFETGSGRPK